MSVTSASSSPTGDQNGRAYQQQQEKLYQTQAGITRNCSEAGTGPPAAGTEKASDPEWQQVEQRHQQQSKYGAEAMSSSKQQMQQQQNRHRSSNRSIRTHTEFAHGTALAGKSWQ